ncbi:MULTISPECIES: hypothetical protein [unclassified Microbacterium]|uniref:hypothetical protein n=1 Tax=unclassified Microbacterium TaxID=2609290 RepID=UPI001604B34D|nr:MULTISPECIES: hypothetical protein [unclassified Microbacterium]QNA91964.1 hypothetical protein G4G29_05105 [Microbacterium sp. Se63.02b]QYM65195.1 hypothetical protein K1X59_05145 [Microbacterium sp. Se5.02b]
MNATNRLANRALLFVAGVILLVFGVGALAAAIVVTGEAPDWIRRPASAVMDLWGASSAWTWQVVGVGAVSAPVVLAAGDASSSPWSCWCSSERADAAARRRCSRSTPRAAARWSIGTSPRAC